MKETVLIHFSGQDTPGLTASLTAILADYDVCVLDIGQAVVHETLALGLLVEVPSGEGFGALQHALRAKCAELGLQVRFTPIAKADLDHWIASQGKDRFIITVLGRSISAKQLSVVSAIIAGHALNVDRIERLSGRMSLAAHTPNANACVELRVSGMVLSEPQMRAELMAAAHDLRIDIAFQRESLFRRNRRLFAFDMDSTLIQAEVIDELAKMAGVGDQVVKITEAAMRGELDFKQSFTRRVGLLRGLPERRILELLETIPLVEGADRLIGTLKMLGLQDCHPVWRVHLLRPALAIAAGHRLRLCERTGHRRRSRERRGQDRDCRRSKEGRIAAPDRRRGKHLTRSSGCGRRRCERSPHAGNCRHGHCLPGKAAGQAKRRTRSLVSRPG